MFSLNGPHIFLAYRYLGDSGIKNDAVNEIIGIIKVGMKITVQYRPPE